MESRNTIADRQRIWGILPILFFALKASQYRQPPEIYQLIWFCNISNLVLGIAILSGMRNLIFICSVLLTIGLPIWIFDFIVHKDFHVFSILTHTVSPALGFFIARSHGWSRHVIWQTIVYYLLLQLVARLVTPPALNINVIFEVYTPVKAVFPNFLIYSLTNMAGLFAFAFAMHKLLSKRKVLPR